MNSKLQKIETPHNQTTHNQITQSNHWYKKKWNIEKIMNGEKIT